MPRAGEKQSTKNRRQSEKATTSSIDRPLPASATMEVHYDDGSGFKTEATLHSRVVDEGQTIVKTYTMTKMGTIEFVLTCTKVTEEATSSCRQQRALAKAVVNLSVPEPATIVGLTIALSAPGLIAFKRKKR